MLFGQEHVERYRATDGEEGHDWHGTTVLLLTTTGRKSRAERTTPLIYQRHGDAFLVVASNGGGDAPGWFLNLERDPLVSVQVKATVGPLDDRDRDALRHLPGQGRARDPGGGPRTGSRAAGRYVRVVGSLTGFAVDGA